MAMDPRLMNNDLGYAYKYMKAKNQTASGFENDLEMTLHALHQQADVAAILRSDWQHLRRDEAFLLEAPGEQVLLLNRCLRTGELTKEKMIKLTRYLLTQRMFEQQVENGRLNSIHLHTWYNKPHKFNVKSDDVFQFAHDNLGQLEELINELEREHRRAERDFHRSKTIHYPEQERHQLLQSLRNDMTKDDQCSLNEMRQLRNKLKDQELELKRMQDTINSLKEQTTQNTSDCSIEVTVKADKITIVEPSIPDLVSDDECFDRMLDEVQGNNIGSEVQEQDQEQANIDHMEVDNDVPAEQREHHQQVPFSMVQLVPVPAEQREQKEQASAHQLRHLPPPANHQNGHQASSGYRPRTQIRHPEQHRQDDSHLAWTYADRGDYHLQAQAEALREMLHEFPYRTIRDSDMVDDTVQCIFCMAVARHYSDSCPVVIDGDERFAIVMNRGICRYCLEDCPAERCRFRTKRPCWYCKKIEGTIVEDLIPEDRGHHRALCPVQDKRAIVRERLARVQREIGRMWPQ